MGNSALFQHMAQHFRGFDGNGSYQHRLALFMGLYDLLHNRVEFFLLCLINGVLQVLTDHRAVCGDHDNIHAINIPELPLLRLGCTGHTGLFAELIKEVLEGDGSQSPGLSSYVYVLLCLNGLVETVGIPAARHNTASELVNDQYLVVLYHIVLIPEHHVIGTEGQDDIMLDLQVLRIGQVFNMEELLHLLNAFGRQVYNLILLIDNEISGLLDLLAHDSVEFIELSGLLAPGQLSRQHIADLVKLCGLPALAGNDQRRSGLIDEDRVHLVDDTVIQIPQNHLLFVDGHIVTKIVKAQLIVRHIGDIAVVGGLSFLRGHGVQYHAHLKA